MVDLIAAERERMAALVEEERRNDRAAQDEPQGGARLGQIQP
jgi:hypothetical protein